MSYSCVISMVRRDTGATEADVWDTENDVDIPSNYKRGVGTMFARDGNAVCDVKPGDLARLYAAMCVLSSLRPIVHKLAHAPFDCYAGAFAARPGYYKIDAGETDKDGYSVPNAQEDVEIMQKAVWWTTQLLDGAEFDTTDLDVTFFDLNDCELGHLRKLIETLDRHPEYKAVAYVG